MTKIINDALIQGDLYSGICVAEYDDATYFFTLGNEAVQIERKLEVDTPSKKVVSFSFLLQNPSRFRVDVLIPEDCKNAQVGLNGKELIGFFDKSFKVADEEPLLRGDCKNHDDRVSTLHPGEFQALNFEWENNDKLIFAFYY